MNSDETRLHALERAIEQLEAEIVRLQQLVLRNDQRAKLLGSR